MKRARSVIMFVIGAVFLLLGVFLPFLPVARPVVQPVAVAPAVIPKVETRQVIIVETGQTIGGQPVYTIKDRQLSDAGLTAGGFHFVAMFRLPGGGTVKISRASSNPGELVVTEWREGINQPVSTTDN